MSGSSRLQPAYPTNFLSTQQEVVGSSFILYPIKQTQKGSCHKLQTKGLGTEFGKASVTIPPVETDINTNSLAPLGKFMEKAESKLSQENHPTWEI